jgi:glucosamine-6-phosphate deaminase
MSTLKAKTEIHVAGTAENAGLLAAQTGAALLRDAIARNGSAGIILATGMSQVPMLDALLQEEMDWARVTAFHLDEYVGITEDHPASFRRYLRERFTSKVPLAAMHFLDADSASPEDECKRAGDILRQTPVDVAFVGIGENGHLAFNDPPADFETDEPYLVVALDEKCRMQQVGEGWFAGLEDVPTHAVSMSIRQILHSNTVVCTCPDARKAEAVAATLEGPITPLTPASILRVHPDCRFYLDTASAGKLRHIGK